jgi:hypothetical protein
MLSNTEAGNSSWSEFKILNTRMEPEYQKREYAEIYAVGTGARNHNASVVKVDNFTLLDHGAFRGLYLIVLDRRDLQKVYSGWYDLMKHETGYEMNQMTNTTTQVCFNVTTNNTNGTTTLAGGITYIIPKPSETLLYSGLVVKIILVTPYINYTTVCNKTIYRTQTHNFTDYHVDPVTFQITSSTSK